MAHKFNVSKKSKLDNEWRRKNIPPKETLLNLGLLYDDTFADIGCGIGYFTIEAAGIINSDNKIFAMDISDEMLTEVDKRAKDAKIFNILTIRTDEYDLKITSDEVSFALVVNVLHEIDDKRRFIKEISRILKSNGRVALIEWDKRDMDMGPPTDHRISSEELKTLFLVNGFEHESSSTYASMFYGEVFRQKVKI